MKYNKDFNEYLFDLLLEDENISVKELPFVLSKRLIKLLERIKDKYDSSIARKLLYFNQDRKSTKITLIDYDDENYNIFTFINSNKYFEYRNKKYNEDEIDIKSILINMDPDKDKYIDDWKTNRSQIKIGKFIVKVFKDMFDNKQIEDFVNNIKSERTLLGNVFDRIKVVEGEDIKKYYNENNYDERSFNGSTLGGSCMRYKSCQNYIEFYSKNSGVKLVILLSEEEEDKIMGRALLWDIATIDGEDVDRKFMDRIYTVYKSDEQIFKDYAVKNNWLYKKYQNMDNYEEIYDPEIQKYRYYKLKTVDTFKTNDTYPFMDTMKYFLPDSGFLTNNDEVKDYYDGDDIYFLESTSGGYDNERDIYVDYYGQSYSEDELTWCELGNEYRLNDDAYYIGSIGEYATNEYVEDNMYYYDYQGEYLFTSDATYSDYKEEYIPDEYVVKVYRTSDYDNIDDLFEDDDHILLDRNVDSSEYFPYVSNEYGELYFDSVYCEEDFDIVHVSDDIKKDNSIYLHKIWDKDKYFKWKGQYYLNTLKDKLTGQKRLWERFN